MPVVASLPSVKVGGLPLPTVAPGWGDLSITHRWPGGCWEASWTVPIRKLRRHQALVATRPVVVSYGGTPIWRGTLAEPDWDTGQMTAVGLVRQGEEAICVDSGGLLTTNPNVAIDAAIARGAVDWVRRASFSSVALTPSGSSDRFNTVTALLDAYCKQANLDWGVNARGEVYTAPRPTTPSVSISPDSGVMGLADQTLIGTALGRYLATPSTIATAVAGSGRPEVGIDLTKRGVLSPSQAVAVLTGIRDAAQARPGWTNGLTLAAPQIANTGGARINLASLGNYPTWPIAARLQGVRDQRGLDAGTTFPVGEVTWDVEDRTVQLSPMGLIDRSLQGLAEDAGVTIL